MAGDRKPHEKEHSKRSRRMEANTPKPIVCKAAVSRAAGEPLRIEEVVVAPPKAHEVRIKIICTSLCHTDVTLWRTKEFPGVFPRILGHESVGVVESVGEGAEDEVAVGDVVLPVFLPHCLHCADCRSSKGNLCKTVRFTLVPGMPRDGTSRFTAAATGEVIHNSINVSSFVEYTVVDVANVVKVEPGMPPEKASLFACGVTTGVGAAWKAAIEEGSTVAVFGLGTIGLAVVQGARICGAAKIIGVDINSQKFEIGKQLGLTDSINPNEIGERPVSEVVREMTGGGADYCFECIGLPSVMSTAFQSSRPGGGKTIILGFNESNSPISIGSLDILAGKSIEGSYFGGVKPKTDIPILMKRYLNKELLLDQFITHEVAFEDINKAFDLLLEGKSLRCTIWMDKRGV